MHLVQDLDGTNTARAVVGTGGEAKLILSAASGFSENGYYPAESLTVDGIEGIIALHALCEAVIDAHNEQMGAV